MAEGASADQQAPEEVPPPDAGDMAKERLTNRPGSLSKIPPRDQCDPFYCLLAENETLVLELKAKKKMVAALEEQLQDAKKEFTVARTKMNDTQAKRQVTEKSLITKRIIALRDMLQVKNEEAQALKSCLDMIAVREIEEDSLSESVRQQQDLERDSKALYDKLMKLRLEKVKAELEKLRDGKLVRQLRKEKENLQIRMATIECTIKKMQLEYEEDTPTEANLGFSKASATKNEGVTRGVNVALAVNPSFCLSKHVWYQ